VIDRTATARVQRLMRWLEPSSAASVIARSDSRGIELAYSYLKVLEITRRNTRVHFTQPLKERSVREVGYGLSLEGASAADLVKSMQADGEA
jgi:hypothetical protein